MFQYILILLGIVLFHELGHIVVSKKLGYDVTKIEILPFGGLTTIDKKINTPINHELLISISGVLFQLLLSIIMFILFNLDLITQKVFIIFNNYNLIIILFNLIPIVPLDGYQILKSLLEKFLNYQLSFIISNSISFILIVGFFIFNYLNSLNNYLIFSFLIYKIIIEIKNYDNYFNRFVLERYLYKLNLKKIKVLHNTKINKMYKDRYHIFKKDDKMIEESRLLAKMFDKS